MIDLEKLSHKFKKDQEINICPELTIYCQVLGLDCTVIQVWICNSEMCYLEGYSVIDNESGETIKFCQHPDEIEYAIEGLAWKKQKG